MVYLRPAMWEPISNKTKHKQSKAKQNNNNKKKKTDLKKKEKEKAKKFRSINDLTRILEQMFVDLTFLPSIIWPLIGSHAHGAVCTLEEALCLAGEL